MIRQIAVMILFVAVSLFCTDNHSSKVVDKKSDAQMPSALTSPNNQTSTPNTNCTNDGPPKWYASPEWWLVILGFPTLFFIGWQAKELRSGGGTTNLQLRHLINSERAWIQVPEILLRQKLSLVTPSQDEFHIWLHPYIVNNGRTQARITKIFARAVVVEKSDGPIPQRPPVLPEAPDYTGTGVVFERNIVLSPKEGINWINVPINVELLERIKARQAFVYIYGCIDYLDISDTKRYTRFCRIYWIPYGPSDPVFQEDFATSTIIPRAYTECT
jgi:hypothetical protein